MVLLLSHYVLNIHQHFKFAFVVGLRVVKRPKTRPVKAQISNVSFTQVSNKKFCGPCYFAQLLPLSPSPPIMHASLLQDFVILKTSDNKTSYEVHNATFPPCRLSWTRYLLQLSVSNYFSLFICTSFSQSGGKPNLPLPHTKMHKLYVDTA
jgi:hypothetical protein